MKKWYERFEERVNHAVYRKGRDMVETRMGDIADDNEYEEAMEDLMWAAVYNDGGTRDGVLSIFEIYFLMVEADDTDTYVDANEVLAEYFINLDYDEQVDFSTDYDITEEWLEAVA